MKCGEIWLAELDKRRPAVIFRVVPWLNEVHLVPPHGRRVHGIRLLIVTDKESANV